MERDAGISITGLTVEKAGRRLLDGIDLMLTESRIGLVGRNGSGKTTLARAICGLIEPQAGAVTIRGVDVVRDRKGALGAVGMIFQNPDHQIIFPTVVEEIAFGLRQQGRSRREARAVARDELAIFGREDWAERPVATLSQGQRHLVCLISVLAMKPSVLLLDEPFTGLDIPTVRQLQALLRGLDPQVIHITHDPALLDGYDRVLWLDGGRVQQDGPAPAVLRDYLAAMTDGGADAFADLTG
ncbi:energy-coupling factor ABC transporter ATP-binding protein [Mesobacterium pallidum]|uniref:energy-coupling factor ABC transporter ATP-binding protein n=1 Tax=Mesobacterium pallidum TaxID=2872037 RepID=UPI001EE20324|nr:ABC transporter ATP-binding protein [Mesobacterium pallidum]